MKPLAYFISSTTRTSLACQETTQGTRTATRSFQHQNQKKLSGKNHAIAG